MLFLLCSLFLLSGCGSQKKESDLDDFQNIKKSFLFSVLQEDSNESPFYLNYALRTVFFSKDIVSFFGEISACEHPSRAWSRYEGKTFCKVGQKFKEVKLWDLFKTANQKEFLRQYCENDLRSRSISYFSGEEPLRKRLDLEDIHTFIIDDKCLIILFQPYVAGGLVDGSLHVKIPYEDLGDRWDVLSPLALLLPEAIFSKSYIASWE